MNSAVEELFGSERITAAGILAPARRAEEACRKAAENGWPCGVHWTLHSEWPGEDAWPPLSGSRAGGLLENGRLAWGTERVKRAESAAVTAELEAQYDFMAGLGCVPDHADSHGGTLYGMNGRMFFLNAFRICGRLGLPFRFAEKPNFIGRMLGAGPGAALRLAHLAVRACGRIHGVMMPDDFFSDPRRAGQIGSAGELAAYYEKQLRGLEGGICEVFLHPALPDARMSGRSAEWQKRVWEYEYLKSGSLLKTASELGFVPASWSDVRKTSAGGKKS